jgi:hypothetical protein
MRLMSIGLRRALLSLGLLSAATASAKAYPVILTLENVAFSDGSDASGNIYLNVLGFTASNDITTTTGTVLTGSNYLFPGNPAGGYSAGEFSAFAGQFIPALFLDLAMPFSSTMSGTDAIIGGCETNSFVTSCGADSVTRPILLSGNPELVVPEPISLATLASGFVMLVAVRWRTLAPSFSRRSNCQSAI